MSPRGRTALAALASLVAILAILAVSWDRYDVDEFVNVQQGHAVQGGDVLYDEAPSNHPPGYALMLSVAGMVPGSVLLGPRLLSALMLWGTGLLIADLYRRSERPLHARWFLGLWIANVLVVVYATRASNEVPVMFLLAAAAYLLLRRDLARSHASGWWAMAAGLLIGSALLTRYTTVFFLLPFLFLDRRRLAWLITGGALIGAAFLAWFAATEPFTWANFWHQTVAYHQGRPAHPAWYKPLIVAATNGTIIIGLVRWLVPTAWNDLGPLRRPLLWGWAGTWAMVLLPVVWPHYLLPAAPIATVVLTHAVARPGALRAVFDRALPNRHLPALGAYLMTGIVTLTILTGVGALEDLDEVGPVAAHVEEVLPPDATILADHPEFAMLAERHNLGHYYWTVSRHGEWPAATQVENVTMVVVRRPGTESVPALLRDDIGTWPCRGLGEVRVYWNPMAGPAPGGYEVGCPGYTRLGDSFGGRPSEAPRS